MADLARLTTGLKRVRPFLIAADHSPANYTDRLDLRPLLAPPPRQLSLFG
jgi:predicted DNA-binding helix-hairpin-helix protein